MAVEPRTPRASPPRPAVRQDPSGELRRSLELLIARGRCLERELQQPVRAQQLQRTAVEIEAWKLDCLQALRRGFGREAAAEFLAAATRPGPHASGCSPLPLARRRIRDALDLLLALKGTLNVRGGQRPRRGRGTRSVLELG